MSESADEWPGEAYLALNRVYRELITKIPQIDNPACDREKPHKEIIVGCRCGARYRTWVNEDTPEGEIPGVFPPLNDDTLRVTCGNCGRPAISGGHLMATHSGGVFNAFLILGPGAGS